MYAEHISPGLIAGLFKPTPAVQGELQETVRKLDQHLKDNAKNHIERCDECATVFAALRSNNANDILLDYVFETREALRQMWVSREQQVAEVEKRLTDEISSLQRIQWWMFIGVALLVVLRLWPGLFR